MSAPRDRSAILLLMMKVLSARSALFLLEGLVFLSVGVVVWAQKDERREAPTPVEQLFPGLRDRAIICTIEARLVDAAGEVAWNSSDRKVTIPGRPVTLRLVGDNVVMALQFTPYFRQPDEGDGHREQRSPERPDAKADQRQSGGPSGGLPGGPREGFLVAQGQIWVNIPGSGMRYQSMTKTIPMVLDEPIYFFPLGESANDSESRLEIELALSPYMNDEAAESSE
jgi:hypothetical protein